MRIVTTSAVFLALAASSASAQTPTAPAPGKPLPLLQVFEQKQAFEQKEETGIRRYHRLRYVRRKTPRARIAHQKTGPMHHAIMEKMQPAPELEQTVTAPAPTAPAATVPAATTTAAPANIWPAPNATLADMATLTMTPRAAPIAASEELVATANPNDMLTAAYHTTVQVTPPSAAQTPPDTVQVTPANPAPPADIASDRQHEAANAAAPKDPAATWSAQRAMVATAEPQNSNPVGSVSWIVHVLAALGGAMAAGALAWVLIEPLPVRRYE
jgi:hypothetical protein